MLGEGAYGWVYKCTKGGQELALKKFKDDDLLEMEEEDREYILKTQKREVTILKTLGKHPNCVHLVENFVVDTHKYLVFEFMKINCLEALNKHPKGLEIDVVRSFTLQLLEAVKHCHDNSIIHRDIKPENILLSSENLEPIPTLKLCDFGAACSTKEIGDSCNNLSQYVGSRWYRAPELLSSSTTYTKAIDIWSSGCIIAELCKGDAIFFGNNEEELVEKMTKILGPMPHNVANQLKSRGMSQNVVFSKQPAQTSLQAIFTEKLGLKGVDLLRRMIQYDADSRIDATDCILHSFFRDNGKDDEKWEILATNYQDLCGLIKTAVEARPINEKNISSWCQDVMRLLPSTNIDILLSWVSVFVQKTTSKEENQELKSLLLSLNMILEYSLTPVVHQLQQSMVSMKKENFTLKTLADSITSLYPPQDNYLYSATISAELIHRIFTETKHYPKQLIGKNFVNSNCSEAITSLSPLILETSTRSKEKFTELERIHMFLGVPGFKKYPELLNSKSKSLLLYLKTTEAETYKKIITLPRNDSWRVICNLIEDSLEGNDALDSGTLLAPYYESSFGKKVIYGKTVEEGEGSGPRKELFAILSSELKSKNSHLLIYHKQTEGYWINTKSNNLSSQYLALGILLGLALSNNCLLDLRLHKLFFRIVLRGVKNVNLCCDDLVEFDPSMKATLESISSMNKDKFKDLLKSEGIANDMGVQEYLEYIPNRIIYGENGMAYFEKLHKGISMILPINFMNDLEFGELDLEMACCGGTNRDDFEIEDLFLVKMEPDLENSEMKNIFWEVVRNFDLNKKRKLLQFVTGTSKLPERKTEFFRIESPFVAIGTEETKNLLNLLPQSHTCDNTLELPNYYEALLSIEKSESKAYLRSKAKSILAKTLDLSIEHGVGYGLDFLDELPLKNPTISAIKFESKPATPIGDSDYADSYDSHRGHDKDTVEVSHVDVHDEIPDIDDYNTDYSENKERHPDDVSDHISGADSSGKDGLEEVEEVNYHSDLNESKKIKNSKEVDSYDDDFDDDLDGF